MDDKPKKKWAREWMKRRREQGCYSNLLRELAAEDANGFRSWLRFSEKQFQELVNLVGPRIMKKNTVMREAISPGERLAITLRYLATGESFLSMEFNFRVSRVSISQIVSETCEAIYSVLKGEYLKIPSATQDWEEIAKQFQELWQFPNCLGALDGKHIAISPPPNSGSYYYNYKGFYSIVMMALVDADLKFIYVDVGTNGRISDGGVWNKCHLHQKIRENALKIPDSKTLPGRHVATPYVIVADYAFSLKPWLLKPYSDCKLQESRIFNYRLSRARRCSENAFGVFANRWRAFLKPIPLVPEKVRMMVLAACCLHNYMRKQKDTRVVYTPPSSLDQEDIMTGSLSMGSWRNDNVMLPVERLGSNNYTRTAKEVRDEFRSYFVSNAGAVSWQWTK